MSDCSFYPVMQNKQKRTIKTGVSESSFTQLLLFLFLIYRLRFSRFKMKKADLIVVSSTASIKAPEGFPFHKELVALNM